MNNSNTTGMDTAKNIFHTVELSKTGRMLRRKKLKRRMVLQYFANLPCTTIVMESCGGSHYWARELIKLGHICKLIAPQHVKPYLRGNKNDYNDALAIAEASQRDNMRFVQVKSAEQQDSKSLHCYRERVKHNRVALANQIRGLMSEYGVVIDNGFGRLKNTLPNVLSDKDNGLTSSIRRLLNKLYRELLEYEKQLKECEKEMVEANKLNDNAVRLQTTVGIGPITANALVAEIGKADAFKNGRHLSAWIGLVPKQHTSGSCQATCRFY